MPTGRMMEVQWKDRTLRVWGRDRLGLVDDRTGARLEVTLPPAWLADYAEFEDEERFGLGPGLDVWPFGRWSVLRDTRRPSKRFSGSSTWRLLAWSVSLDTISSGF